MVGVCAIVHVYEKTMKKEEILHWNSNFFFISYVNSCDVDIFCAYLLYSFDLDSNAFMIFLRFATLLQRYGITGRCLFFVLTYSKQHKPKPTKRCTQNVIQINVQHYRSSRNQNYWFHSARGFLSSFHSLSLCFSP